MLILFMQVNVLKFSCLALEGNLSHTCLSLGLMNGQPIAACVSSVVTEKALVYFSIQLSGIKLL